MSESPKPEPKFCKFCGKELARPLGRGFHRYCPPKPGQFWSECWHEKRIEQLREAVACFFEPLEEDVRKAYYRLHSRKSFLETTSAVLFACFQERWSSREGEQEDEARRIVFRFRELHACGEENSAIAGALALQKQAADRQKRAVEHLQRYYLQVTYYCKQELRDGGELVHPENCAGPPEYLTELADWCVNASRPQHKSLQGLDLLSRGNQKRVWADACLRDEASRKGPLMSALEDVENACLCFDGGCLQHPHHQLVAALRALGLMWKIRLRMALDGLGAVTNDMDKLRLLAAESRNVHVQIETVREDLRYQIGLGRWGQAEQLLQKGRNLQGSLTAASPFVRGAFDFCQIKLLYDRGRKEHPRYLAQARHLAEEHLKSFCRQYPHPYFFRRIFAFFPDLETQYPVSTTPIRLSAGLTAVHFMDELVDL